MRKNKLLNKTVALAMTAMIGVGMLTGCGNSSSSETTNTEMNANSESDPDKNNTNNEEPSSEDNKNSNEDPKSRGDKPRPEEEMPTVSNADLMSFTSSTYSFDYELFEKMYSGENMCISPYSLKVALAMAANAAEGNTLEEFKKVIGFDNLDELNENMYSVMKNLEGDGAEINIANSLWYRDIEAYGSDSFSEMFQSEFVPLLIKYYEAETQAVDFSDVNTVSLINDWCAEKTNDKIKKILNKGDVNDETNLALLNAVYFNGKWDKEFEKDDFKTYFYSTPDDETLVKMMSIYGESFSYVNENGMKVIRLKYKDSDMVMDIYITDENGYDLKENAIEKYMSLTAEEKSDIYTKLSDKSNITELESVKMPKFEIETDVMDMVPALKDMGLITAFKSSAEFNKISEGTAIDKVIQKAYIKVDEKGTEAAAVTGIIMKDGCALIEDEPERFIVDQPFVYVLSNSADGNVLFMGAVTTVE